MQTYKIRKKFLEFFNLKNHKIINSYPLVGDKNTSTLFSIAGMTQFKDYFLNPNIAKFKNYASSQKCLRAGGDHND